MRMRIALIITALIVVAVPAAAKQPRPGIYSASPAVCKIVRMPAHRAKDFDNLISVNEAQGNFLVVENGSLGHVDVECAIGREKKAGKETLWPLNCGGEASGGKKSTVQTAGKGKLKFSGGMSVWGTVTFCR